MTRWNGYGHGMLVLNALTTLAAVVAVLYAWRAVRRARMSLVTEIRLQRLQMASSLANLLSTIHRAAGSRPQDGAELSSLRSELKAELALFNAINGPPLQITEQLVTSPPGDDDAVRQIAQNSLGELAAKAYQDDRLLVALDENLNPVLRREDRAAAGAKQSWIRRFFNCIWPLAAGTRADSRDRPVLTQHCRFARRTSALSPQPSQSAR